HADAEERERGLGDDDLAELQGGQYDGRVDDVGQDVLAHDRPLRAAGDDGQAHELPLAHRQDLAADDPRAARPVDRGEDDDDVGGARPDDGGQEDREGERGQREPGVGDAHDDLVDPAAEVAGDDDG